MSKEKNYYALTGVNAYGIYTNLENAKKSSKYIINFKGKIFTDFESAKVWAVNTFHDLQPYDNPFPNITMLTRTNWLYYRQKPRRYKYYD